MAFGGEAQPEADKNESGNRLQAAANPIAPQHVADVRYHQDGGAPYGMISLHGAF